MDGVEHAVMTRIGWLVCLLLICTLPACSKHEAQPRRLADEPLRNEGEAMCQVIPQSVFRPLLAAPNPQVEEDPRGDIIGRQGGCAVVVDEPDEVEHPLTIEVRSAVGRLAHMVRERDLDLVRDKNYVERYFTWLPRNLGYGGVHRAERSADYVVWSLFQCGQEDSTLWLSVHGASPEREDPVADAITLMRFAQNRYEELLDCTVGPPSSTSPPESETTTD